LTCYLTVFTFNPSATITTIPSFYIIFGGIFLGAKLEGAAYSGGVAHAYNPSTWEAEAGGS
jgi:hypothetical protein